MAAMMPLAIVNIRLALSSLMASALGPGPLKEGFVAISISPQVRMLVEHPIRCEAPRSDPIHQVLPVATNPAPVGCVTSCVAAPATCAGMVSTTPTNSSDPARTVRWLRPVNTHRIPALTSDAVEASLVLGSL